MIALMKFKALMIWFVHERIGFGIKCMFVRTAYRAKNRRVGLHGCRVCDAVNDPERHYVECIEAIALFLRDQSNKFPYFCSGLSF